jgi:hypothetical protein
METPNAGSAVSFNPELFLNQTSDQANSTEYVLIPVGEYVGVIGPISADSFKSFDIKKGENAGKKAYRLDLKIDLNDETGALKELLGRAPSVTAGIMLDIKADGSLEFGKGRNVQLGRLREAVGQNSTGRPWSFGHLAGQPVKIKVVHDTYDGKQVVNVKEFGKAFG